MSCNTVPVGKTLVFHRCTPVVRKLLPRRICLLLEQSSPVGREVRRNSAKVDIAVRVRYRRLGVLSRTPNQNSDSDPRRQ